MKISSHKPTITLLAAIFLIAVGSGLLIAGFCVPPPGEIHNSVLVAFGEILTFAGAVFGMKYHYQYGNTHTHIDKSSNLNNTTDNDNNP